MVSVGKRRSFIFDMDGVLIHNEPLWEKAKEETFTRLYGNEVYAKMGSTVGLNMEDIHKRAVSLGATATEQALRDAFYTYALSIYETVPITEGIQELGEALVQDEYAIGIVSASPLAWIQLVVDRLSFKGHIEKIISLDEREDLAHKPAPDGYLETIRELNADPSSTVILEDSNAGIASAKAAGAYVIGLKQNLVQGYVQKGADRYVNKVKDIIPLLKSFN